MDQNAIRTMSDHDLRMVIATMSPTGSYGLEVAWAKEELARRGVYFGDCLEPSS